MSITQIANFGLYKIIAIRNYLLMPKPARRPTIISAPRPWLTREAGECAFPFDGEGVALRACCNPCGRALYCPPHAAVMRGPKAASVESLEREIMKLLERSR